MLDISSWEIMVVLVAALLVVGPAKLPGLARTVGQWVGKIRGMAREFQRSLEDAARDADLDELRKTTDSIRDAGRMTSPTAWAEKAFQTGTDDPGATASESPAPKPEAQAASRDATAANSAALSAKSTDSADSAASAASPTATSSDPA